MPFPLNRKTYKWKKKIIQRNRQCVLSIAIDTNKADSLWAITLMNVLSFNFYSYQGHQKIASECQIRECDTLSLFRNNAITLRLALFCGLYTDVITSYDTNSIYAIANTVVFFFSLYRLFPRVHGSTHQPNSVLNIKFKPNHNIFCIKILKWFQLN